MQTIKRRQLKLKVLNLLLLNIASSCEKVLMTFLKATCICVQTGQRLLHKSTFFVEWLNNCFSSNSELQVFISITSLNQCTMAALVFV